MLFFGVFLRESARTAAKSRTNLNTFGKSYQTAGPIGTKFGTHVQIHMGMDIRQTNCASRHEGGTDWGVLGGQKFKIWGSCQTAGPIGTNFGSRLRIRLGMDIG